eukprot:1179059-Prorocentrum_minimum.AAC.6
MRPRGGQEGVKRGSGGAGGRAARAPPRAPPPARGGCRGARPPRSPPGAPPPAAGSRSGESAPPSAATAPRHIRPHQGVGSDTTGPHSATPGSWLRHDGTTFGHTRATFRHDGATFGVVYEGVQHAKDENVPASTPVNDGGETQVSSRSATLRVRLGGSLADVPRAWTLIASPVSGVHRLGVVGGRHLRAEALFHLPPLRHQLLVAVHGALQPAGEAAAPKGPLHAPPGVLPPPLLGGNVRLFLIEVAHIHLVALTHLLPHVGRLQHRQQPPHLRATKTTRESERQSQWNDWYRLSLITRERRRRSPNDNPNSELYHVSLITSGIMSP